MTAKGELERLDQLGRSAARKALHQNHWMNHARHKSHTDRHAALGSTSRHNTPIVGRLAVSIMMFVVIGVIFSWGLGIDKAGPFALASVLVLEAVWYVFKRRRLSRLQGQAVGLNAQLHDLKEQDFQLRYEEAKANGDLDRFNKGADS